jgi:hypothetical protein
MRDPELAGNIAAALETIDAADGVPLRSRPIRKFLAADERGSAR